MSQENNNTQGKPCCDDEQNCCDKTAVNEDLQTELEEELSLEEKREAELSAVKDNNLRLLAEMDNLRKRTAKDIESARTAAMDKVISEFLPIADSLDLGLMAAKADNAQIDKIVEGFEMSTNMFTSALEKLGVEVINPEGEAFNPEVHQAMSMVESAEHEPNTVINVMQKGCRVSGRLVRPALVIVSKKG